MDLGASLQLNLNFIWVLLCASLVFVMQAGFMCVEAGLATAKNSINVAIKNLADFVVAVILFWVLGFGLMFGATKGGWVGATDFFVEIDDPWRVAFFVFQAVFVGTAATIDSGAVAGRTKFKSYLIMSALISGIIYPVFGHWAWGGLLHDQSGWLEARGFKDFAGSTVVHSVGGWMALVGIIVIGPRIGKYGRDGRVNRIPPHNMALAYLGTFILFFGWFGFNCGSTLEAGPDIAPIALNTMLAACFGCLASSTLSWIFSPLKRPEGEMIANGMLGGLVGITAGCAFVNAVGAVLIGLSSGIFVYAGSLFVERVLRLDDVVSAVTVHGICGAWGTLALGLFILPEHLGELTRLQQIGVQLLGVGSCFVWTFGVGYASMWCIDRFCGGMRVSRDDELLGLNISEHGASSSVLDLVHAMHRATESRQFSEDVKVEVEIGTEIGDLAHGFNKMVDAIRGAFRETEIQISKAQDARKQAEEMQDVLNLNREEHQKYVGEIADNLGRMMTETENTLNNLSSAAEVVSANVRELREESQKINEVLKIINKLAMSSTLLALNAQVEAARAGEAGIGFAVVAQEMASFSRQTTQATEDIARVIGTIQNGLGKVHSSTDDQHTLLEDGSRKTRQAASLVKSLLGGGEMSLPEPA